MNPRSDERPSLAGPSPSPSGDGPASFPVARAYVDAPTVRLVPVEPPTVRLHPVHSADKPWPRIPREDRHVGGGHHRAPVRWWSRVWAVILWVARR